MNLSKNTTIVTGTDGKEYRLTSTQSRLYGDVKRILSEKTTQKYQMNEDGVPVKRKEFSKGHSEVLMVTFDQRIIPETVFNITYKETYNNMEGTLNFKGVLPQLIQEIDNITLYPELDTDLNRIIRVEYIQETRSINFVSELTYKLGRGLISIKDLEVNDPELAEKYKNILIQQYHTFMNVYFLQKRGFVRKKTPVKSENFSYQEKNLWKQHKVPIMIIPYVFNDKKNYIFKDIIDSLKITPMIVDIHKSSIFDVQGMKVPKNYVDELGVMGDISGMYWADKKAVMEFMKYDFISDIDVAEVFDAILMNGNIHPLPDKSRVQIKQGELSSPFVLYKDEVGYLNYRKVETGLDIEPVDIDNMDLSVLDLEDDLFADDLLDDDFLGDEGVL